MNCDECNKNPASLHFTQVNNGQKVEMHLCQECATKKGINMLNNISFNIPNMLGSLIGQIYSGTQAPGEPVSSNTTCPVCGASFADIRQTGKLGCGHCYETYQEELESTLRRVQGHVQHTGKIPARSGRKVLLKRQINRLKTGLQEAVVQEDYEKAAEIRDSIKEMERQL